MGTGQGVVYGNFERKGSTVNEDFELSFSLKKDGGYSTVVPFGILDFEGKYENANFVFSYSLMLSNIDSLKFKVLNETGVRCMPLPIFLKLWLRPGACLCWLRT